MEEKISLDKRIEEISDGTLYWITGLSGAGKTTIGNRLFYEIKKSRSNVVLLDGDVLKKCFVDDEPDMYSDNARHKRAFKYSRVCKMLTDQGIIVICCTIAMYDDVREWNRKNNKRYVEVFLDVPIDVLEARDQKGLYSEAKKKGDNTIVGYNKQTEYPKNPNVIIKNDGSLTIEDCVSRILDHKAAFSSDYDRDTSYWNNYYDIPNDLIVSPSLFAIEVSNHVIPGKNILELGCGNGRDSLYFDRLGLNVTAIDASDKAIDVLRKTGSGNSYFICDDFVSATALYTGQYDYVYSRFSLHAINSEQEDEVIKNVYAVLKTGGKFFIEVRSVNDDIYGLGEKVAEDSYYYEGHFRRFVRIENLKNKLINIGFKIIYAEEKRDFAPFGDSNPPVIRIIVQK